MFAALAPFALSGGLVSLPFVNAAVTVTALAGIHAALNEGHLPSLLLAAGPTYGLYTFNGPGAAPVWAAELLAPVVLTYGTLGVALGLAVRWVRGGRRLRTTLRGLAE